MNRLANHWVSVKARVVHATLRAVLLSVDGKEYWFPRKLVRPDPDRPGNFEIKWWIAQKNGLA